MLKKSKVTFPSWKSNSDELISAKSESESINEELIKYYNDHLPFLITIPFKAIHEISKSLAENVLCSSMNDHDWMDIASELGCDSADQLKIIAYEAQCIKIYPFYHFLTTEFVKRKGSWGDLGKAFIKLERYDLLLKLRPFFQEIVSNKRHPPQPDQSILNETRNESGFGDDSSLSFSSESFLPRPEIVEASAPFLCQLKTEEIKRQTTIGSCYETLNPISIEDNESIKIINRAGNDLNENVRPSAPASSNSKSYLPNWFDKKSSLEDRTTIFITHTENEIELAYELSKKLYENFGFEVHIQDELDAIFATNPFSVVKEIVQKVDFIVPLVSNQYLSEIDVASDPNDCSTDRLNVRYIFQNLQNNLFNAQCINKKIRPLLVEGADRELVRLHLEFQCILSLWKDLGRFGRLINSSKALLNDRAC